MQRFFLFDERTTTRFLSTTVDGLHMVMYYAELGAVHRVENSQPMTAAELSENIAMAFQHGYVELTEEDFRDKLKAIEVEFEQRSQESYDPSARIVEWSELADTHADFFVNNPAEYLARTLQKFCCYDQPVHTQSDLLMSFDSLAPTVQTGRRNLIFHQGLRIDGNFDAAACTSELPLFALVKGDLHCHNLLLNCWAELVVTGNLYVSGIIVGYDGETGGRLKVHGDMTAQRILSGAMYPIEIEGQVNAEVFWFDLDEPTLAGSKLVTSELTQAQWPNREQLTPLVDDAYYAERNWASGEEVLTYQFNFEFARDLVRRGDKLFR